MKKTVLKKGSLALIISLLILIFPVSAAPLYFGLNESRSSESRNTIAEDHESTLGTISSGEWRKYDINGDGKFNEDDINEWIDRGWNNIDFDLNGDGKKDVDDVLALFIQLTVMDRTCNRVVDDEDFEPVKPVTLPDVPDRNTIRALVSKAVVSAGVRLPPDIEKQAFREVPAGQVLSPEERAYVYQLAGLSGLAQYNLDAAIWGFGRAFQTSERSASAIGNLAFCLMSDNQDNNALLLLSFARDLFPKSAPAATSLGWIFARHGQNDEALDYFRKAIQYAPEIGQYHMNLGVILLREGRKREAFEAFRDAYKLDPGDAKKMLFWYSTKPPDEPPRKRSFDPEEYKRHIELERRELQEHGFGEDEMPTPWSEMSPCDQANAIPEILERMYGERMERIARDIANNLAERIESVIKGYLPEWSSMIADWNRFIDGLPVVYKAGKDLTTNAEIDAGHRRAALTREMGSILMGYSSFFMECALQEAKLQANMALESWRDLPLSARSVAELKSESYKDALEDALKYCYRYPMDQAFRWLTVKSTPYWLPKPDVETITAGDFYMLALVIPAKCFEIRGYCPENGGETRSPGDLPGDNTFGINLWLVNFEYNSDTGEMELNIGQGIIVGVTWRPETGFGMQIGAGIDGGVGPVGGTAVVYAKYDEGQWTFQGELGGSVGLGPLSAGVKVIPFQLSNAFE